VGAVAWGGRSPDLVVVQAVEAAPDTAFADLGDSRPGDRVRGGVPNHLYVRVFNARDEATTAELEVFQAPLATLQVRTTWVRLGGVGPFVVPGGPREVGHGWTFAPVVTWTPVDPDPAAPAGEKPYALVAIVQRADDQPSDFAPVTALQGFWDALRFDMGADNVALRVLPFEG